MKISLDGFKKVSKDGDKTILRHPSGHEMAINHSILSPKMRGEIEALPQHEEKLAEGGEAEPSDLVKSITTSGQAANYKTDKYVPSPSSKPFPAPSNPLNVTHEKAEQTSESYKEMKAEGGEIKKYAEGEVVKDNGPEAADKRILDQNESRAEKEIADKSAEADKSQKAVSEESKNLPQDILEQVNSQPSPEQYSAPQPYDHAKDMLQAHSDAMDAHNTAMQLYAKAQGQPQQSQDTNITAGATPGADQTAVGGQPVAQPVQPSQPDQSQQPQQAGPPAVPSPATPGVGTYDKLAGEAQQQITGLQDYVASQKTKNDSLMQSIMQDKIDPNKLYSNMSTGSKIVNAIGLILGGLGAGATGGRNLAVDAMNHVIERDVEAQKANVGNQMNLYRANLEATHNEVEARNLTVNQLLSAAQGQLNKAGMQTQNQLVQSNILKNNEEINQLKIGNSQKAYLFNQLSSDSGGSPNSESKFQSKLNTLRMLAPDMGKDLEAKYLPGVGVAGVPIPEAVRTELIDRKNLSDKLAGLENFAAKHGGTNLGKLDPEVRNQGLALAADAQNAYRSANRQGVFKESESKFVNKVINEDPSAILAGWSATPGYRQTRHTNDATIDNMKRGYGVKSFDQGQQNIPEGSMGKAKDGSSVIRKNGQWVRQ